MSENETETAKGIEPALTAEEWRHYLHPEPPEGTLQWALRHIPDHALHGNVALANERMPDDHPGKITREDVQELVNASSGFIHTASGQDMALRRIADKLAALLPPEPR